jgi:hypothetical protein
VVLEPICERDDLVIRRLILGPGEAMYWHTDTCHRFTVVVRGQCLNIEYLDGGGPETVDVRPGLAGWEAPHARVHRAVNAGTVPYEEVVTFYRDSADVDPQPRTAR